MLCSVWKNVLLVLTFNFIFYFYFLECLIRKSEIFFFKCEILFDFKLKNCEQNIKKFYKIYMFVKRYIIIMDNVASFIIYIMWYYVIIIKLIFYIMLLYIIFYIP